MDSVQLRPLDAALVVIYLLGVMGLGLWMSRGVKSTKDFFLAGRSLPWWAVAMSLVVSDIGAKDMIGVAADSYRYGVVMMNFDFIGCTLAVLLAAFLFMPFFWMAGIYTIPEYLGRRYNDYVRRFFAVAWTFFMLATLGTIFVSAAAMFKVLLGWPFWLSVGATAIMVAVYTTVGGLKAVVVTDAFSCAVLMVGAGLICGIGLHEAGGWTAMQETIREMDAGWTAHHFELVPPADHPKFSWPAVFLGLALVLGPSYWIGNQAIVQRNFGTRSENEARSAYVLCAAIKMFFPLLLVVPGLIALALFHGQLGIPFVGGDLAAPDENWQGNLVLPLLIVKLLPTGVLGMVVGAFLAGVLSNLDSYVNSASTLVVNDLYRPLVRPGASDRECLVLGRALVVAFVVCGAGASYLVDRWFESVFDAFQTALSFIQGSLFALLLLGMLWRRTTQWGGLAGMLIGVATAVFVHFHRPLLGYEGETSFLWVSWWSFAAAIVSTVVVTWFTTPYDEDRLRGLVCWIPLKEPTS
ncbi:MAG: sodium/solute symporter [Planctomycetes bacterium]|nr:sodium/solute symporter [Planctomycetota bacterium]MBL7038327.1 sodium/solute symporter [Pirellulaceae bacterium]